MTGGKGAEFNGRGQKKGDDQKWKPSNHALIILKPTRGVILITLQLILHTPRPGLPPPLSLPEDQELSRVYTFSASRKWGYSKPRLLSPPAVVVVFVVAPSFM